jgi:3-hydroxyisobutyrate dehydrogenase-like beta-hydroxyacid dehydrogenase
MKRTIRKSVGIIGLGIIGRRIADHLRHQGLSVFVWNRTPKPVPNFVGSPSELAQTCNYLQVFVSDDDALMRMIQTISMALTPRHIVIAHPTVSPETMREAAGLVERRGARLVEAPFTGSKLGAEKGQLVYYVSGDEAAIEEVRPLLQASSKAIVNIGAIGEASIIKIATNMVTAASVQGAAEAMAIVHYSGIPLEKFLDALKQNASNSGTLDLKVPQIIAADFKPHFSVKHMLKDMQIANRMGRHFDLDLTVAGATRDRLLDEASQGRGDDDYSSIARRFLPFVKTPDLEERQPDLFSPKPVAPVPNENPEFIEQQLAELEKTQIPVPTFEQEEIPEARASDLEPVETARPDAEVSPELEQKPVEMETPREIEPAPEEAEPVKPVKAPAESNGDSEPEEEKRGFFSRLLRRTDY